MYVSEQLTLLDTRLEDPARTAFPPAARVSALTNAQYALMGALMEREYTTGLEHFATGVICTAGGVVNLSGLNPRIALDGKGVRKVRINGGAWASPLKLDNVVKTNNGYATGTELDPLWYTAQGRLYMIPATVSAVDILYLRVPSPLLASFTVGAANPASTTTFTGADGQNLSATDDAYNGAVVYSSVTAGYHVVTDYAGATRTFTVTPAASAAFGAGTVSFTSDDFRLLNLTGVQSELNEVLHPLLVTYAEIELWRGVRDHDRMESAAAMAAAELNALNGMALRTEPLGTGYDGAGRREVTHRQMKGR